MISASKNVDLDESIFGGLPGILPEESKEGDKVDPNHEQPASAEYFIDNKIMGVPVDPKDQQLAIRESDNVPDLFEQVGNVKTLCFLLKPGEVSDSLQAYNEVLTLVRNGSAAILKEDHTYDPALQGYVIMLTYSCDTMKLKKEYEGHFVRVSDIISTGSEVNG